jgi:PIN domain
VSEPHPPTVVDAGGLIAVERDARRMRDLVERSTAVGAPMVVPAPVLAQVWRGGARQALLARFLDLPIVEVDLLTRATWQAAGLLCGKTGTADVVDAAVVACAHRRAARVVITSDPDDLRTLDATLTYWTP